ncbi:MAG: Gfo/Idh/MocA family oxidoreductase, partial [Desulfobacterales bacterium]|nr:Gfo/Idh/MocA family oxidoreductase [Desulfobacterales bacterium]
LGAQLVLCDTEKSLMQRVCSEIGEKLPCYTDYLEAVGSEIVETAVIATPTSTHLKISTDLAIRGIHLFIEKPLSHSLQGVRQLLNIVEQKKLTAMMGQSYRFHEGFLALKELLDKQVIGRVYYVYSYSGWFLPDWHIHEDYRNEYAAKKSLGGGVALTSLSHSFDTFRWLFGEIEEIVGWKRKISPLSIDVEDSVYCMLRTERNVIINCVSDFFSRFPRNEMTVIGAEGHIDADFSTQKLNIWKTETKRFLPGDPRIPSRMGLIKILEDGVQYDPNSEVVKFDFDGNKRYLDELSYFFERVLMKDCNFALNLHSGVRVLELLNDVHFRDLSNLEH